MIYHVQKIVRDRVEEYQHCECKGRNKGGKEIFDIPVEMSILISSLGESVCVDVECPYNTGAHGQRCKAAHPHIDKVEGKDVTCPYSFDLPIGDKYLLEHKKERKLANKDLAKIAEDKTSALHPWKHLFV